MIYIIQYWNQGSYWYGPEWWDYERVTSRQVFSHLKRLEKKLKTACRAVPETPFVQGEITLKNGIPKTSIYYLKRG